MSENCSRFRFFSPSTVALAFVLGLAAFALSSCSLFASRAPSQSTIDVIVDVVDSSGNRLEEVDSLKLIVSGKGFAEFQKNLDVRTRGIKLKVPSGAQRKFVAIAKVAGTLYSGSKVVDLAPNASQVVRIQVSVSYEAAAERKEQLVTSEEVPVQVTEETSRETAEAIAPTVKLELIHGPEMAPGDIVFVRYKARATGTPPLDISFNRDDSGGAWGKDVAQVNLASGESFRLEVTVKNSAGEASDSVLLAYHDLVPNRPPKILDIKVEGTSGQAEVAAGSGVKVSVKASDPDGDLLEFRSTIDAGTVSDEEKTGGSTYRFTYAAPAHAGTYGIKVEVKDPEGLKDSARLEVRVYEERFVTLSPVSAETGTITSEPRIFQERVYTGDDENNFWCKGFVSFDISSLAAEDVQEAAFSLGSAVVYGSPAYGFLQLFLVDYGTGELQISALAAPTQLIAAFPGATTSFDYSGSNLLDHLRSIAASSRSRLQFMVSFEPPESSANGAADGVAYLPANISLRVRYRHW